MDTIWQDVKFAGRMLRKSPAFTLVAVLTLALGIGANTAIFSVVNAVLIRPLPYQDSGRIVLLWESKQGGARKTNTISGANFLDWRDMSRSFESMAAFYDTRVNLTGMDPAEEIPTQAVMPEFFQILGIQPVMGRVFTSEDAVAGKDDVILLGHGLWQRRFGSDPGIVGKSVQLNGRPQLVIGVLPQGFNFLIKEWSLTRQEAEIWAPITLTPNWRVRSGRYLSAVAKLRPGVSVEQAQAELSAIAAGLAKAHPEFNTGWGARVVPLRMQLSGEIRRALLVLLGAVGFVLLICCANVANLLLARAASRRRELAIRTALGSGRWRTVRQLLTESAFLAGLGGALGIFLASWGLQALLALSPPGLLSASDVKLDPFVLGFTLAISLLTGLIFGTAPALHVSRLDVNDSLKEGDRRSGGGLRSARTRNVFAAAEVALALVLLISAGLLGRSFLRLQNVSPGFDSSNVLTARVTLPRLRYAEDHLRLAFFRNFVAKVAAMPGVRAAGAINFLPLAGPGAATNLVIEGRPAPPPGQAPVADVRVVHPDFFRTMGVPFLRGRNFSEREAQEMSHVVVINQTMAKEIWPGEDPIGKRVTINMKDTNVPSEVIGVVGDVKLYTLDVGARSTVYWPHPELVYSSMTLVVRTDGSRLALAPAVQATLREMDSNLPLASVRTMESWLAESVSASRFNSILLAVFAGVALVLAMVGIYGVMSYSVAQRSREMGIRMALGAQARDVLALVVRQGMWLTGAGIAAGLLAALALTRFLVSLLFAIQPADLPTYAGVSLVLAAVALAASWIPARRATRVDPVVALRDE